MRVALPASLRSRAVPTLAAMAILLGVLGISLAPAAAQDDADAPLDDATEETAVDSGLEATLGLVRQSASVESDGFIELAIDWTGPVTDDFSLSVLFHQRISDPSELGTPSSTILNRRDPIPLTAFGTDADGNLTTEIPVRSVSPADDDRVYLPGPGVYPFTVEIRSANGPLASVSSTIVRLPQDQTAMPTIDMAVVLDLSPADGLDLSDGIWLLTTYPDVPFTVQIGDGLLRQLEEDPPLAQQFAAAAGDRVVLSDAGIDLDPSALEEIGQGQFFTSAVTTTNNRLRELGLTPSTDTVMLSSDLTVGGAEVLARSGLSAIISTRTTQIETGTITTSAGAVTLIQTDQELSSEVSSQGLAPFSTPKIYAFYARLSLLAETAPTPVILGGRGTEPLDSQSLETFLGALIERGPIQPVSLSRAITGMPRNPLLAAERPEQDLFSAGEAITELQQLADTSRSFRGIANPDLEPLLVSSLSRSRNPEDRTRAIARAKEELLADLTSISLPESQSLTLTAVEGPLPLTIRNDADSSRFVLLEFRGDRVSIAENNQVVSVPPGETTIELSAEALALGVSTLEVTARTPDGERILSTSRYQIRSTAVPGLGWAISGAALAFLLLWWFRNSRNERPRQPHLVGLQRPTEASAEKSTGQGGSAGSAAAESLVAREAL